MGASVQTSLGLFDAFSRPLKSITQALNLTISAMEKLQSTTNQNNDMAKTFTAAKQQIASAEAEINAAINKSTNAQNNFNSSVGKGRSAFSAIGGAIVVMNQGLELAKKLFGGVKDLMTFADDISSANAKLGMMTDNLRTQRQLQQQVMDVANRTRQSYSATTDLMTKLGMGTEGVFKNNDAQLAFTERFNKTLIASGATAQQSQDAILQMSQALGSGVLQGDELRSISEQAPLVMKVIADGLGVARGSLKKMGADGKLTADLVVKAFEKQSNAINTMFDKMPITFGQSMTLMKNKASYWIGKLNSADGPLQKITRSMQTLVVWMDSSKGAQFFNVLSFGIATAATGFSLLTQGAIGFWNFVSTYWPEISVMLLAWASFYFPLLINQIRIAAVAAWNFASAWLVANWPILLVVAAVGLLVYWLRQSGVTGVEAAGVIMGAFEVLKVHFQNVLISLQNGLIIFGDFFRNVMIDPVYAFKKLIYDLGMNFFNIMYEMTRASEEFATGFAKTVGKAINKVLDGIDWLAKGLSVIPGFGDLEGYVSNKVDVTNIHGVSSYIDQMRNELEKFKPTSDKPVRDSAKIPYKTAQDYVGAFNRGYQKAGDFMKSISGITDNQQTKGKIPDIGKVGEVGKIKDTVDISNEDLKVMRDLAEMKNIQNFITLTPTVQLTGDIHNHDETDVDTMIKRIEEAMESEIANSAQGVYQP